MGGSRGGGSAMALPGSFWSSGMLMSGLVSLLLLLRRPLLSFKLPN